MVDAEAQTEPPLPAAVVGVEQDVLLGARVRKSFGARAFWGSVVGCYWVSGGLFYKVSFDDGDVDIFSADEVLRDAQEAKNHAKESAADANKDGGAALDAYLEAMRHHSLKRKRDGVVDCSVPNVRRVQLWGQRLYASIYTNERNETFIKELLRAEDGGVGEMESTGHVQVGDMILAVNQTRALGLPSRELAELIKKPKRPITLTFYRPPQNRGETEQQAQGERVATAATTATTAAAAAVAPAAATTAAQGRQPPASAPASAPGPVVMPPSFVVPQPAFGRPGSAPHPQWTQPPRPAMTEKEALRQSLLQRFAERQRGGYVPGMPIGVVVPGNHFPSQGVPVPAGYTAHRQQYVQSIVDAAAMRVSTAFTVPPQQQVRPMPIPRPQASVPVSRVEYYTGRNQRQRTTGLTLYEQVQQMQAQRNATSGSTTTSSDHTQSRAAPTGDLRTISALTPDTGTSTARNELERQAGQTESARNHPDASTSSRQSSNSESASERNSAESILRESTRVQTSAPSTSVASTSVTDRDVQAIAPLAEKTPTAARHVWNHASSVLSPNDSSSTTNPESSSTQSTSFLTPSGTSSFLSPSDSSTSKSSKSSAAPSTSFLTLNPESADKSPTTVERAAETASHSMSFLSPTDFNVEETSLSSRQDLEATSRTGQINSNVSLVTVKVTRRRLYLTLGVQGTLIAVTSFVPDEFGRPGEVEVSGKVLPGDVLVRVNSTYIRSGMTPGNVAEIVNATPRPMTLWFERASWDILDGKA